MHGKKATALAAAASGLILGVTACSGPSSTVSAPEGTPKASNGTAGLSDTASEALVMGHGRSRTASRTAEDWATYADHVLVVKVVSEKTDGPSKKEAERGEGMFGRVATLKVQKVLWSAPDAPRAAPDSLDLEVAGFFFNNNTGKGTIPFVLEDSSRINVGHTYVKAVEWIDDPCSADPAQGSWEALGTGDTIPYDDGMLGAGEFEGKNRNLDEAKAKAKKDADSPKPGLRAKSTGGTVDELVAMLNAAAPRKETGYGSVAGECERSS